MLLRWLHVTAAIAWIGASFLFMHLDASLRKQKNMQPGVYGVSWQVHGGGFYEMSKYTLAPAVTAGPPGLAQVAVLLDLDFRLQPAVLGLLRPVELLSDRSGGHAARARGRRRSIGVVARSRSAGSSTISCASRRSPSNDALLALVGFGYVVLTSYVFTLIFSGRGALIHTGALMATMMTANVFFVIMPNQRKSIARAGRRPDAGPEMGQGSQAAFDAQQLHHAARAVHDAVEPLSRDLRQCARHSGPRHAASSSPARWSAISTICGTPTTARRRGGRGSSRRSRSGRRSGSRWRPRPACAPRSASAPAPPSPRRRRSIAQGAGGGRRGRLDALRRCAMRPSRSRRASARRRRAFCSTRPNISRRFAPGDPHAGRADPCHAAQQSDGNDRRPSARVLARWLSAQHSPKN